VMCTHGRGGLLGLVVGSIAQQVIALGKTPVFLVQPDKQPLSPAAEAERLPPGTGAAGWGPLRRLMVPLDGNPDHEQGLSVAIRLAECCGSELHLLMVVPTTSSLTWQPAATARLLPSTTDALLDLAQQEAVSYLRRCMLAVQSSGLTLTAEVQRGDAAEIIVKAAERAQADLIVLGTHGRSQMNAFWSGSVTPKVAGRSRVPLLLVPVPETQPER
jgi:nucleotide-binding universal stress UspA family protein